MNSHTPPDGNSPFPNEIDLSDIFIGREKQLDQFRSYLERWQRLAATAGIPDLKAPPSPNDKIQGFVALLHGRGGFGKSTLLKRYREIALEYSDNIQVSDLIDWEFAAQERRALFNPAQGEAIDASHYFSFIRDQLALALGRPRTDFKEYQVAARAVDDAKKQAQGVLKGLQQDDRYAWLRSLPGEIVLALIQSVPVVKNLSLLKDDAIAKAVSNATNAGVTIGVEQIAQVWATLHERLGDDLSDYLDAPWRLGKAIGYDLAQFARKRPILIFFDTYEEIDEGDKLLQMIMGVAGGRVGWVIAGRDNLWAGVGQRHRSLEVEYGYRDLVLPDRRMVIDFSADGVGDFTSSDIEEYFTQLSRKAFRLGLPAVSEKDAVHIRDVTGGVPLAVKIAAGLYLESQDLALITESLDGKREIVDQMVERYLLHTRTNPADRSRLNGLALLRRPAEQRALAAALDVPDNYDAELARLHRRYGFIFTKQEQPALHQEVRYFLRLWLLQHRTSSPEIMRVISRLREALFTSFQELEAQRHYASLRQRLEDEQWIALYLDLTEQQFWLDPAEGVAYVLPFMFAASVYQREANRVARTIGEFFQATLVQPYRKQWDWANQSLVYSTSRNPLPEELSGLKDVVRLASQNKVAFFPPMPLFQEELEAAVWWRLGEAYRGKSPNKCVYWYEKALGRLLHEEDLREALMEAKLDREHAVTEEEADEGDLLQQTVPTLPGGTPDGGAGGTTTSDSQRTMAELDRALERDPKSVRAYVQRGDAYAARKEYRQAIADFDHALELAPQDASLYAKRGEAYLLLREYRRALVDFDRALELEPGNEAIRTKQNEASLELTRPQQTPALVEIIPAGPPRRGISRRAVVIGLAGLTVVSLAGGSLAILLHAQPSPSFSPPSPNPTQTAIVQAENEYEKNFAANGIMYGFNAQHTRTNPYEIILNTDNVSGLKLYWTASTKGRVSSSPAVAPNGVVYVGSEDSNLYAFDTTNKGATLWKALTGGSIRSSPAVAPNGVVYVGSDDGYLYAFDPSTGNKPLWTAKTGDSIISSPTLVNGIVYIGSWDKTLYAFNATSGGMPLWTFSTGNMLLGSPAVANGVVYIGSRDGTLYAFNALTGGEPLWTFSTKAGIDASPAVANGVVYIGSRDGTLYAINASTGMYLWKATTLYTSLNSSAAVANEVVYVGSRNGNLYAFDTISNRGSELWHALTSSANYTGNNGIETSPTVANGVVYVASDDGHLYAFKANTGGTPLWTFPVGAFYSCPAVANGVIYIGSEFNNALYAFHLP